MPDFELPEEILNKKINKKKKKKDKKSVEIWESKSFLRCRSCGHLQLKSSLIDYWKEPGKKIGKRSAGRILGRSTCRFCGHKINGRNK